MGLKCFFGHKWFLYRVENYIDGSFGGNAYSHSLYTYCKRCGKTKVKNFYGKGWLEPEIIDTMMNIKNKKKCDGKNE